MFFMENIILHSHNFLLRFVDTLTKDIWDKGSMIFSATTNSTQTADYLLDNVTKRTKGQYGPIVG